MENQFVAGLSGEVLDTLSREAYQGDTDARAQIVARFQDSDLSTSEDLSQWLSVAAKLGISEAGPLVLALISGLSESGSRPAFMAAVSAAPSVFRPDHADASAVVAQLLRIEGLAPSTRLSDMALAGAVMLDAVGWKRTLIERLPQRPLTRWLDPVLRAAGGWAVHDRVGDPSRETLLQAVGALEERLRLHRSPEPLPAVRAVAFDLMAALVISPAELDRLLARLTNLYGQESEPMVRAGIASALGFLLVRHRDAEARLREQDLTGIDSLIKTAIRAPPVVFYGGPRP